ncbi:MAG: hypothetical protein WC755_06200 [Candidatus Woesearchaeota archaeon]|jgi:hypothetical protein
MVIDAKKLEERVLRNEADNFRTVEKSIDAALEKAFDGQRAVFDVPIGYNQLHTLTRKEMLNKYRNAGWDVKYESSQRDGDFLEFAIKKNYVGPYGDGVRPYETT